MMWRALVLAVCTSVLLAGSTRPQAAIAAEDTAIAQAKDLFLANRLTEALEALDDGTLAHSGKANLLAGLIHLYRPHADHDAAIRYLEHAGELGIAHAYAIVGNLILEEGCANCSAHAIVYYERALELEDDPGARFGIALALEEQGRRTESLQMFESLLSDRVPQFWRMWAASFVGGLVLRKDPGRGEMLLTMAATADFPEAQAFLGFFLLQEGREAEGEMWLTRAVAHRSELVMEWYGTLSYERQADVLLHSSMYLLELIQNKANTEFMLAAEWCERLERMDLVCLSHAVIDHQECRLDEDSGELLKLQDFEHSAVYRACRSREHYGRPLPEKLGAWPRLAE
jgi:tetratricopeptide (TPR) repeat protein